MKVPEAEARVRTTVPEAAATAPEGEIPAKTAVPAAEMTARTAEAAAGVKVTETPAAEMEAKMMETEAAAAVKAEEKAAMAEAALPETLAAKKLAEPKPAVRRPVEVRPEVKSPNPEKQAMEETPGKPAARVLPNPEKRMAAKRKEIPALVRKVERKVPMKAEKTVNLTLPEKPVAQKSLRRPKERTSRRNRRAQTKPMSLRLPARKIQNHPRRPMKVNLKKVKMEQA